MADMISGAYVAWHPQLCGDGAFVKIGHTGSLGDRLNDDAYVTCFPPGWVYVATVETACKEDAFRIEQCALRRAGEMRVPGRELVRASAGYAKALLRKAAEDLGVDFVLREGPSYKPARVRVRGSPTDPEEDKLSEANEQPEEDKLPEANEQLEENKLPEVNGQPEEDKRRAEVFEKPATDLEERPYQAEAAAACVAELDRIGKTTLVVACRCGKTYIAFLVMRDAILRGEQRILFIAPSLQLISQTAEALKGYLAAFRMEMPVFQVGSAKGMSTDSATIESWLERPCIIISTYDSSRLVPDQMTLTVFDEAHRVCGSQRPSKNNFTLLNRGRGKRLFMTATPIYANSRKLPQINMSIADLFGGVAYRYTLREGIGAGYASDFSLNLVEKMDNPAQQILVALRDAWVKSARDGASPQARLLVFGYSIAGCQLLATKIRMITSLCKGLPEPLIMVVSSRVPLGQRIAMLEEFATSSRPALCINVSIFSEGITAPGITGVYFATPKKSFCSIIQSLSRPLSRMAGKPVAQIYVPEPATHGNEWHFAKDFGEEDDICADDLEENALSGDLAKLERFATFVPYAEALASEDPTFLEHLLDPHRCPYKMSWVGPGTGASAEELLAQAKRAMQFRGGRIGARGARWTTICRNLPWKDMFAALKKVVYECGRYPKNDDGGLIGGVPINLGTWYKYVCEQYAQKTLEPYQIRDLETLPQWKMRGVRLSSTFIEQHNLDRGSLDTGAYPANIALAYLEQELERTGGQMPIVVTSKAWVGLDATPIETLSGFCTVVNTMDGMNRLVLRKRTCDELDRIMDKYGLRWRKERGPDGVLTHKRVGSRRIYSGPKSCFQLAQDKFTRLKNENPQHPYIQENFPDYPLKADAQERLDVILRGLSPPKYVAGDVAAQKPATLVERDNVMKIKKKLVAGSPARVKEILARPRPNLDGVI